MYADIDDLAEGKRHHHAAADQVHKARTHLQSAEVTSGMFGETPGGKKIEDAVRRAKEQHVGALGDLHRNLTSIIEGLAHTTTDLPEADRAGGDTVRAADTIDRG